MQPTPVTKQGSVKSDTLKRKIGEACVVSTICHRKYFEERRKTILERIQNLVIMVYHVRGNVGCRYGGEGVEHGSDATSEMSMS